MTPDDEPRGGAVPEKGGAPAGGAVQQSSPRGWRIAVGALVFALAGPLTYAVERAYEWSRGETGDPRLVLRSLHTVYFWRIGIAFWWAIVVAILVSTLLRSAEHRQEVVASWLSRIAIVLVPATVLLHFLLP